MTDIISLECIAEADPGAISPDVYRGALIKALTAIKELQWRIDNNIRGCQCSDDEACAHVRRAEKAEADLATARKAILWLAAIKPFMADNEKINGWEGYEDHAPAIAAARAQGGE